MNFSFRKYPISKSPQASLGGLFFVRALLCSALVLMAGSAMAQVKPVAEEEPKGKKIEILNSDRVSFDKAISEDAQMLVGNVQLMHKGVLMFCDSALLYQGTNKLEAYGDVEINQGDTLFLYGDSLFYNGNIRQGKVMGDVLMQDKETDLTTDVLLYNAAKSEAYYTTGGKIVSKKNKNVLTSVRGTYSSKIKMFYFKDQVVLTNPEYTVNTDTMDYNTNTETAFFFGPTKIKSKTNFLYAENGWYNTKVDNSSFRENSYMISGDQRLEGDSMYYDGVKEVAQVFRNITITDTVNDFIIIGDYGIHFEKDKTSMITLEPRAVKIFDEDSLYIKADTIYVMEDTLGVKTVLGYHNVSYFKNDMQGVCDTIIYGEGDSSITMLNKPVVWNEENQITGHLIILYNDGKNPREMYIDKDSYITQLVDTIYNQYNQVKGRELHGYFKDGTLDVVDIKGNGETIFYIQEDTGDSITTADGKRKEIKELIGINKAECSDIRLTLDSGQVKTIKFSVDPVATAMAVDNLGKPELLLKNFKWEGDRRPLNKEQVMQRVGIVKLIDTVPPVKKEIGKAKKEKKPKKAEAAAAKKKKDEKFVSP